MKLPAHSLHVRNERLKPSTAKTGVNPSDCPRGILGAPCRARRDICRAGCATALAAATAACSAGTAGLGAAACIAAATVAAEGCRRECDNL
jgi:hypothetical protein